MSELLSNKKSFIVQKIFFVEKKLNNKKSARQILFEILTKYLYFFLVKNFLSIKENSLIKDFFLDKKNFSDCNQYEN